MKPSYRKGCGPRQIAAGMTEEWQLGDEAVDKAIQPLVDFQDLVEKAVDNVQSVVEGKIAAFVRSHLAEAVADFLGALRIKIEPFTGAARDKGVAGFGVEVTSDVTDLAPDSWFVEGGPKLLVLRELFKEAVEPSATEWYEGEQPSAAERALLLAEWLEREALWWRQQGEGGKE